MINNKFSPIILSGPSGAGKTELIEYIKKMNNNFEEAPGITTRPRREGEYGNTSFVSEDEFKDYINKDKLIQYTTFNGNYYGTLKTALDLLDSKQAIFNMGLDGAKSLKKLRPDAKLIYILPPSKDEVIRRMGNRDKKRYELGIDQTNKSVDLYDYLLISYTDNLEKLYEDFTNIYLNKESSKENSLKLEKNKNFMKNFYN